MAQKVIDVVGTSKESFAKAAENAVAEAAKTVRCMKWARVAELERTRWQEGSQIPDHDEDLISTLKSRDCSSWNGIHANESAPDLFES